MEELIIGDKKYIPSKTAAKITGYAKDYVGQLCREGRVEAKLVGRSWYILESSIREHRFGGENKAVEAVHKDEVRTGTSVQKEIDTDENLQTWESPKYSAEEVETMPTISPTYLTNTTNFEEKSESPVAEMQNAWKEWFTARPAAEEVPEAPVSEEIFAPEPVVEEVIEEVSHPEPVREVPMHHITRNVPGRMDIKPLAEPQIYVSTPQRIPNSITKPRKTKKKHNSQRSLVSKALFVAFVLIISSIAIIGTGVFDAIGGNSAIINFLGGVEKVQKAP